MAKFGNVWLANYQFDFANATRCLFRRIRSQSYLWHHRVKAQPCVIVRSLASKAPEGVCDLGMDREFFRPTLGTLEELENQARAVDFAVVIVTPDDLRESRGSTHLVPRDNVIFECGLFMGALERERVFLLAQEEVDLKLASDFHGVTALYFRDDAQFAEKISEILSVIDRKKQMLRYCKVL